MNLSSLIWIYSAPMNLSSFIRILAALIAHLYLHSPPSRTCHHSYGFIQQKKKLITDMDLSTHTPRTCHNSYNTPVLVVTSINLCNLKELVFIQTFQEFFITHGFLQPQELFIIYNLPEVTNKLYNIMLYRVQLVWAGFELTILVVIGTNCIDNNKSNYHTIPTTSYTYTTIKNLQSFVWISEHSWQFQITKHHQCKLLVYCHFESNNNQSTIWLFYLMFPVNLKLRLMDRHNYDIRSCQIRMQSWK